MNQTRVLVVDDEAFITELVATTLKYEKFDVRTAGSGQEALDQVAEFDPQLIVLDVMLPDIDGFEIVQRLGAIGKRVPVLFLTARDTTEDKVRGLTIGGDDYVTKPFSLAELVARVNAVVRRTEGETASTNKLTFADLEMDEDLHEVRRAGHLVELTATEYRLLRYLLDNARRVRTRAQILDHVWEYDFGGDARVLESYISYLRKKIDSLGTPLIHTVRGVGYVLREARD